MNKQETMDVLQYRVVTITCQKQQPACLPMVRVCQSKCKDKYLRPLLVNSEISFSCLHDRNHTTHGLTNTKHKTQIFIANIHRQPPCWRSVVSTFLCINDGYHGVFDLQTSKRWHAMLASLVVMKRNSVCRVSICERSQGRAWVGPWLIY